MKTLTGSTPVKRGAKCELLIRGGLVLDAKNGIHGQRDIAIVDGKIAKVAEIISNMEAETEIDATGLLVSPGFIDMHCHHFYGTDPDAYLSNGNQALPPDGFTFRTGVTSVLDTGGSGWKNFEQFKNQTIDQAATRVFALLNIIGSGMKGGAIEQNLEDMEPEKTAAMARKYPEHVIGIKLAHYLGPDWTPTERTVAAGERAGLPVMIDFGRSQPPLPLEELFMKKLRAGDIYTHCYAHVDGREALVGSDGKVRPLVAKAREKGIWFDVGHGQASFDFAQAVPAVEQGFMPDSISTDLHTGCMNGGMKDMPNLMSKFINMGMPLQDVFRAVTWNPAQCLGHPELGHLSEGAEADVTISRLREGDYGFVDSKGIKIRGNRKLECELTIRAGHVVYDLNGLTAPLLAR